MRRRRVLFSLCSFTCALLLTLTASAQGPVDYMGEALENALVKVRALGLVDQVGFTRNHFALLGGLFSQGQSMTQSIDLSRGVTYYFMAGGDRDVRVRLQDI